MKFAESHTIVLAICPVHESSQNLKSVISLTFQRQEPNKVTRHIPEVFAVRLQNVIYNHQLAILTSLYKQSLKFENHCSLLMSQGTWALRDLLKRRTEFRQEELLAYQQIELYFLAFRLASTKLEKQKHPLMY